MSFSRFLLLLTLFSCTTEKVPTFQPTFRPSSEPVVKVPEGQQYTFGYLEVLEDRARPEGPTIQLPVYIFKSRGEQPAPDPIIYTVGGPGSSSMRAAAYMKYYSYLEDRDFILFEQRGTRYAQPSLDCPEWAQARYQAHLPGTSDTTADSLFQAAAIACRDRLDQLGIDRNAYHTNAIAADIEDLRKVLGLSSYNLLTISYSTKIAQVLLRDYPEPIRSVVMDSPLPLEANYDEESVKNLLETLDQLFTACAKQPNCAEAYPELSRRFYQFLEKANQQPLEIQITHSETDESYDFRLKGEDLMVLLAGFSTGSIPELPAMLQTVLAGDYTVIREQLQGLVEGPGDGSGLGMRLSVWCAEELAFADRSVIEAQKKAYPECPGLSPAVFEPAICDIWGVKKVADQEQQPIKSSIPTLLISGSLDPETPPKWAAAMQPNLPNSFHLIFPGWSHTPTTNWGNPCGMAVARAFFNDPSQAPGPPCWEGLKMPVFDAN